MLFARRIPAGVLFALGVVVLLACKDDDVDEDDNQFREDVIQCEEAVARLARCCPEFDAQRVLCNYYFRHESGGCGPSTTNTVDPALNLSESKCVLATSCEDLSTKEVCQRAQEARTYTTRLVSSSSTSGSSPPVNDRESHPPVCP